VLPVPYKDQLLQAGGLIVPMEQLMVMVLTAVLSALLFALFRYTKLGIAMQASSQNQLAAYYMGIPVQRLNGLVWALAAVMAAIAATAATLPPPSAPSMSPLLCGATLSRSATLAVGAAVVVRRRGWHTVVVRSVILVAAEHL
jgi:branched-subunit amino acid ABC-type transport system permease component